MLMHENPIAIATITPSGNTVVERTTIAMLRDMPELAPVFSRLPVHGTQDHFPDSYDEAGMLAAATLRIGSRAAPLLSMSANAAIIIGEDAAIESSKWTNICN
jgi:hypothetical protein